MKELDEAARRAPKGSAAIADLRRLLELLDAYGVADRVVFDASVVRGLAYYTGIVFEVFDARGKLRSICGGGRYDRLLQSLGGTAVPAVGFGFGDAVIMELLADRGRLPEIPRRLDAVVYAFGEEERPAAIRLTTRLRAKRGNPSSWCFDPSACAGRSRTRTGSGPLASTWSAPTSWPGGSSRCATSPAAKSGTSRFRLDIYTPQCPRAPMQGWTIRDSLELYSVPAWGRGFFTISEKGTVEVLPRGTRRARRGPPRAGRTTSADAACARRC